MFALTTRQRDILKELLEAHQPKSSGELSHALRLSPRQVAHSLKGLRSWLKTQECDLAVTHGVGYALVANPAKILVLRRALAEDSKFEIILSGSLRRQFLALALLLSGEPQILSQLQHMARVSRTTILKDIDVIEGWLKQQNVGLIRKPHFGFLADGAEADIQRALTMLLWAETPFGDEPVAQLSYADGLSFALKKDAALLPITKVVIGQLSDIDLRRCMGLIVDAEEQLGAQFTDDAALHVALAIATQASRILQKHRMACPPEQLAEIQGAQVWPVAAKVAARLSDGTNAVWKPADVARIAMLLLAAPRANTEPHHLQSQMQAAGEYAKCVEDAMGVAARAFGLPNRDSDSILFHGFFNIIIPACYRHKYGLWFPLLADRGMPTGSGAEETVAKEIAAQIYVTAGVHIPESEISAIAILLRATRIRGQMPRAERVVLICPSGMATSQLLLARLNEHFPNLKNLEVISLRDLTPARVASSFLILSTVALPARYTESGRVIQVSPLLASRDIEAITQYLIHS